MNQKPMDCNADVERMDRLNCLDDEDVEEDFEEMDGDNQDE